ncbi:MAG: MBOAT family protein [Cyanobacteria bacterium RM1_2_2]|nr:MBOAT family protein [Cyanobacteria bacterium RM1_2_2]
MLFNSYVFILAFLPIALTLFFCLAHRSVKLAIAWLTAASLFFYGFWKISYLPLLLVSIVGNYVTGQLITRCKPEGILAKSLLILGTIINLIFIGYYKYAEFFISSINGSLGMSISVPEVFLPLAISFYTFTQIAYLVDAYRGEIRDKQYSLMTYTLFVTFFPQLIAGPILRHDELIPQLQNRQIFTFSSKNFAIGLLLFILGLSKKVLIADNLSPWVSSVFSDADGVGLLGAWIGALSYTFQLYFDFSGYSDMAIGLGWMFNIQLPINFNSPYKAKSIIDFWRRWHITLSNFLRDYLYIPLGGSRCGKARHYGNLFITMLLGGLWHGAGWTFVFWGGLHGSYLVINHWWRKRNIPMPAFAAWGITFVAVLISWVFFRAASFADAATLLQAMIGMNGIELPSAFPSVLHWGAEIGVKLGVLAVLLVCVLRLPNAQEIVQLFKPRLEWVVIISVIATASLLSLNQVSEFLYFQF